MAGGATSIIQDCKIPENKRVARLKQDPKTWRQVLDGQFSLSRLFTDFLFFAREREGEREGKKNAWHKNISFKFTSSGSVESILFYSILSFFSFFLSSFTISLYRSLPFSVSLYLFFLSLLLIVFNQWPHSSTFRSFINIKLRCSESRLM